MLSRQDKWNSIWLGIVAFLFAEISSLNATSKSFPCIVISQYQSANDQTGYQACASVHEAIFSFVNFIWDRANHENILAFGTIMIAVFTLTLWQSTERLWKQTKETVELARKEFISTHRPILRIRRISVLPLVSNNRVAGAIALANIGDTQARVVEAGLDIYVTGVRFDARPGPIANFPPIPPGNEASIDVVGQVVTDIQIAAIEAGTLELRMLGIINYIDDNDIMRCTSFARTYNHTLRRFVKVSDGDAEADREFEN